MEDHETARSGNRSYGEIIDPSTLASPPLHGVCVCSACQRQGMGVEIDAMGLGFNAAEDFVLKGTTAGERCGDGR